MTHIEKLVFHLLLRQKRTQVGWHLIVRVAIRDYQPSERDRIAFLRSLICTGACWNPMACCANQINWKRRFGSLSHD